MHSSESRLSIAVFFLCANFLRAEGGFPGSGEVAFGDCENGYGRIEWKLENGSGSKVGSYYEGYFKDKLPNGYGKKLWTATGCLYFGEFKDGKEHGIGTIRWPDGQGYTGEFREGKPAGTGFSISGEGAWRLHQVGNEMGLTLTKKGDLAREDIYGITPTKSENAPDGIFIPADLEACFMELNAMLTPQLIEKMRSGTEDDMTEYHFGLGMWIRNNWGLWGDSPLAKGFNDKGIKHADDMAGIILKSFWRSLNKKPLNLDGQIQHYLDFYNKQKNEPSDAPNPIPSVTPAAKAPTAPDSKGR